MKASLSDCNCWLPEGDMELCPFHGPLLREKEPHPEKVEVLGLMELRVKVAELCGWKEHCDNPLCRWKESDAHGRRFEIIPDYPNDLNACAEFRQQLKGRDRFAYLEHLTRRVGFDKNIDFGSDDFGEFCWAITNATATDHCFAFIATMDAPSVPSGTEKQLADSSNPNS